MKELIINEINNFSYKLRDENNNIYNLKIEFHDYIPKVGDKFMISEDLLKQISNNLSAFGSLNDNTGRNIDIISENKLLQEVIIIVSENNKIYLKRLYG